MGQGAVIFNQDDWPDVGGIPPKFLWRVLGAELRQRLTCHVIHEAAGMLSNKKVAARIQEASQRAASNIKPSQAVQQSQMSQIGAAESEDFTCGNGLSALLNWLRHHQPEPHPGPWFDIATIGLMGDFVAKVGGPVNADLGTVLRSAIADYAG